VAVNVFALDAAGNPVTDLRAADFTVFDNLVRQPIVSLLPNPGDKPRPLVILFDLLNAGDSSRGAVGNAAQALPGSISIPDPCLPLSAG
jgi:hypothetical protein